MMATAQEWTEALERWREVIARAHAPRIESPPPVTAGDRLAREHALEQVAVMKHEGHEPTHAVLVETFDGPYLVEGFMHNRVEPRPPLHPLDLPSLALVEHEYDPLELDFIRLEREVAERAS